ncbi:Exocyst complex component EXO84 [Candida viswanathii]|uniref:Exocyst complex component EXO84 n=1 Tax=Candida viswanathii TaxID=5486 RepID=A0A367XX05_9ASCO|nr:Exocyst complex component EXO84 [Candida viswanathii]
MEDNNHLGTRDLNVDRMKRKSRAVWQTNTPANNPYANAPSTGRPRSRSRGNTAASSYPNPYADVGAQSSGGNNNNNNNNNLLAVPGSGSSPYGDLNASKQQNRRLSIHVSARQHGRSFSQVNPADTANLPPLPNLAGIEVRPTELSIEQKISKEISQGSAAEIDDYYKTLMKQRDLITRDMKDNINQNQKNILQLTVDLKETQEELMEMRGKTKDLYDVLAFLERRLRGG